MGLTKNACPAQKLSGLIKRKCRLYTFFISSPLVKDYRTSGGNLPWSELPKRWRTLWYL